MCKINTNPKCTTMTKLIDTAMDSLLNVQDDVKKMFCLQRHIGSFMDDVMNMNPVNDSDSVIHIQLNRHDALCHTDIVLDYMNKIDDELTGMYKTLSEAFELSTKGGDAA